MISTADLGPVRFSHLKAYGRSAAHGLIARTKEFPPTSAMERGTGVHATGPRGILAEGQTEGVLATCNGPGCAAVKASSATGLALETGGVLVSDRVELELEVQAVRAAATKAA